MASDVLLEMNSPEDSPRDKFLYLPLPGLFGWIAGYCFLVMDVKLWIKGAAILPATPFFIGLLSRIDKKSYFDENFESGDSVKKLVWACHSVGSNR